MGIMCVEKYKVYGRWEFSSIIILSLISSLYKIENEIILKAMYAQTINIYM